MDVGTKRIPLSGYVVAAAGTVLFTTINIWTGIHDLAGSERGINDWMIVCWEYTSATMILLLLPLLGFASLKASAASRMSIPRAAAIHLGGWIIFTLLHVTGFIVLRHGIYAVMGSRYDFSGVDSWAYEAPKDAGSYAILVMTLSIAARRAGRPATSPHTAIDAGPDHPRFTIRDGARSIYVLPAEIVAVSSEGNYVEFHLTDGRRPLMRTTLAEAGRALSTLGLVRVHRSWLVNPEHIRENAPAGSGDRRLLMTGGVEVPASRRYAQALGAPVSA